MSATEYAVRCRQLEKVFGAGETSVRALRGVDWDVPLGEISMLVGQSGCGKTTLLMVLTGLLDATAGTVEILGEALHALRGARANSFRLQNIGFIFQQYNLLPALTAAENAAVPLFAAGVPRRAATGRGRALLEKLGLGARADAMPVELSGGQLQRVAIARALINEPRVIVCDEPTASLDAESGRAVMELLHGVAISPDRAVVIVTHDNRIFEFAHSITYMEDGRIVRRANGNGTTGGRPPGIPDSMQ
ncbi:ABC transporter ATP-binding protein [Paraburkholderia sp. IMGN_8]|uniref:ABC transporter ATP-binding protein n=1 Tax=Paraburkholderia sp. IMGN_8 TaxID=3136564 RepID=UPI003101176D